ncbi:quinic acid utilization activator [Colletotrichum tofieldiae]|nr:quinic acid utilization activator [Colletotrichum tofieldiae]
MAVALLLYCMPRVGQRCVNCVSLLHCGPGHLRSVVALAPLDYVHAREKCDGVQPQCFSCVTLSRQCTYNVAPKKRGVQTGLIRTLELALVWLFDQVPGTEEKLAGLLAQEGGSGQSLLLDKDSDAGNRLHKRWRRCRVHKDIDRLLSGKDGVSPRQDTSGDDSDAEADGRNKRSGETPQDGAETSRNQLLPNENQTPLR